MGQLRQAGRPPCCVGLAGGRHPRQVGLAGADARIYAANQGSNAVGGGKVRFGACRACAAFMLGRGAEKYAGRERGLMQGAIPCPIVACIVVAIQHALPHMLCSPAPSLYVLLAIIHSYEGQGAAQVECLGGCRRAAAPPPLRQ